MLVPCCLLFGIVVTSAAETTAADAITLSDGTVVLGQVQGTSPPGGVTILVRRDWARSAIPSRLASWEREETLIVRRARRERKDRLIAWRHERSSDGGIDPLVAGDRPRGQPVFVLEAATDRIDVRGFAAGSSGQCAVPLSRRGHESAATARSWLAWSRRRGVALARGSPQGTRGQWATAGRRRSRRGSTRTPAALHRAGRDLGTAARGDRGHGRAGPPLRSLPRVTASRNRAHARSPERHRIDRQSHGTPCFRSDPGDYSLRRRSFAEVASTISRQRAAARERGG